EKILYDGGYDFEAEIIQAIERTKLEELRAVVPSTAIAIDGKSSDKKVRVYEVRGYGRRTYVESLFSPREWEWQDIKTGRLKTRTSPVYHRGAIVSDVKLSAFAPLLFVFGAAS